MPIRPENRDRYPADWNEISLAVKEAAGWRCECTGECGRALDHLDDGDWRCWNRHNSPAYGTGSNVILTTAHLDHTPENCSVENLRAMCQGCHLHYDRDHHAATRAASRAAAEAEGQEQLALEALENPDPLTCPPDGGCPGCGNWPVHCVCEPTALERIRPLIESGQIRACTRSGKPMTEGDAAVLLEFHDLLTARASKEQP